jgi:hypothetical protein
MAQLLSGHSCPPDTNGDTHREELRTRHCVHASPLGCTTNALGLRTECLDQF